MPIPQKRNPLRGSAVRFDNPNIERFSQTPRRRLSLSRQDVAATIDSDDQALGRALSTRAWTCAAPTPRSTVREPGFLAIAARSCSRRWPRGSWVDRRLAAVGLLRCARRVSRVLPFRPHLGHARADRSRSRDPQGFRNRCMDFLGHLWHLFSNGLVVGDCFQG